MRSRRKRGSSFASRSSKGSLTIEASFCLAMMIFAMVVLMLPMKIMNTRRQLQARLETINEEFCRQAYIKYRLEQGDTGLGQAGTAVGGMVTDISIKALMIARMMPEADTKQIQNVSVLRSAVMEDGETMDLIFDYEIRLPFPILSLDAIPQSVRSCRRAWIGGVPPGGDGSAITETEDRIVYLGSGSTRYHNSRECHYLSNQLQSVSRQSVGGLRNESGGIYHPCSVCGAGTQATVYIMPNGSRYHTQMQCSSIIAYVQTARLSEAVHLGGCSYCVK